MKSEQKAETLLEKLTRLHNDLTTYPWQADVKKNLGQNWCIAAHFGMSNIDDESYILTTDHVHASEYGYIFEHRLVMAELLGRPLLPSEVVHHKDRNKANNAPDNLELHESHSQHIREHMTSDVARDRGRSAREAYKAKRGLIRAQRQKEILCACGCGGKRLLYDRCGRICRYIHGHNGTTGRP